MQHVIARRVFVAVWGKAMSLFFGLLRTWAHVSGHLGHSVCDLLLAILLSQSGYDATVVGRRWHSSFHRIYN